MISALCVVVACHTHISQLPAIQLMADVKSYLQKSIA